MNHLISLSDVIFEYPREETAPLRVLNHLDLTVEQGEFLAILGQNGSGKSTLAKLLNAILIPTGGSCTVCGFDTAQEENLYEIRSRVGMVFQNPDNQLVANVVEEDVAFALENMGVEPGEIRRRVDQALKQVEMYDFRMHAPHQLSGGQKQRIAIAGVLAMEPECIVLDEPTAMLDPRGRREVLNTVRRLNQTKGTTVVLITHYMDEACQADRVVVMDQGQVALNGTPKEVFSQVNTIRNLGLDLPQVTELCWRLRQAGVPLPEGILTEQECLDALCQLLGGGAND